MIKIENDNLDGIADEYQKAILYWLKHQKMKKRTSTWKDEFQIKIEDCNNDLFKDILKYVWRDIRTTIVLKPDEFTRKIDNFNDKFTDRIYESNENRKSFEYLKVIMEDLYNRFFNQTLYKIPGTNKNKGSKEYEKYHYGAWLAKRLNINVCPYCNRQYTFTINSSTRKTRPQFDHFHPKSKHPYLALSFYNLVPSCPICNHLKGEKDIEINPYHKNFGDYYKIKLATKDAKNVKPKDWVLEKKNININFSEDNDNIKIFALEELYNNHIDYVEEIIDKAQAYNCTYYESLNNSYMGLNQLPADIDRFIWGSYLEEAEHCKRPLSKLTRDILEQLEIK